METKEKFLMTLAKSKFIVDYLGDNFFQVSRYCVEYLKRMRVPIEVFATTGHEFQKIMKHRKKTKEIYKHKIYERYREKLRMRNETS